MSRSAVLRGVAVAGRTLAMPAPPAPTPPPADPGSPEALLAAARAEAEAILARAAAEADMVRERARQEGVAAGRDAARAEVDAALAAVADLATGLDRHRDDLAARAADEATALAVEIAAKLVRAEVAAAPERVADVLRGAIRRASDRSRLVARVHPDDLAVCRDAAAPIMERMGGIGALEVVDDPRIARGSCVLETPTGDVDATFESQLTRVLEALTAPPDMTLLASPGP